jgi:hypothetical protein
MKLICDEPRRQGFTMSCGRVLYIIIIIIIIITTIMLLLPPPPLGDDNNKNNLDHLLKCLTTAIKQLQASTAKLLCQKKTEHNKKQEKHN